MNQSLNAPAIRTALAACVALASLSCAGPRADVIESALSAPPPPPQQRIAQLHFGARASFGVCVEPACPSVTAKTLMLAAPAPVAQPEAVSIEPVVITFAFASADLSAQARATLASALPLARRSSRIVITGRTDGMGDQQANQALARARALAVRSYIQHLDPDLPNEIAIDSQGLCCFVASNDTQDGRSKNRRVEILFTSPGGA